MFSSALISTICNNNFTLDKCFKNLNPRPAPEDAPEINPGISATTKDENYLKLLKIWLKSCKRIVTILGLAEEIDEMKVDFPALGNLIILHLLRLSILILLATSLLFAISCFF